jgi:hypothetical protein
MRLMIGTRKDLRTPAAARRRTDLKLEALIDALRRTGGNGHTKRPLKVE